MINRGPQLTLEQYKRTQMPSRAVPRKTQTWVARQLIAAIRDNRKRLKYDGRCDPLTRPMAMRVALMDFDKHKAARDATERLELEVRRTLFRAARVARAMGLTVRASRDNGGRTSSYYVSRIGYPLRISDHEIPSTAERDAKSLEVSGACYDGYHGPQIIIDRSRDSDWIKQQIEQLIA
jgi:hypothetical protein